MSLNVKEVKVLQFTVFLILLVLLLGIIVKRKYNFDRERLKKKLHMDGKNSEIQAIKRDKEKHKRLQPKLEVIAQRLGKIQNKGDESSEHSIVSPRSLHERSTILFINKDGDIIFHAEKFFEILDKNNDGVLSFEEINEVLCLGDVQLRAFIASMNKIAGRVGDSSKVSRSTFTKCFLDALADASQLQPTKEETEEIFDLIAQEVGTTSGGEIEYAELYNSYISSFLNDQQIYGIVSRFKKKEVRESLTSSVITTKGISREDFVNFYPQFLLEVSRPDYMSTRITLMSIRGLDQTNEDMGGLDVAFENLSLTVTVGKEEKVVVNEVSGRLRSNTMTAVMGGSGSGKSSLLNALCGRAFYGKTTGKVFVNGNISSIDNHKSAIGFVPQEDIVYADLTVRENLVSAVHCHCPVLLIFVFSASLTSYVTHFV